MAKYKLSRDTLAALDHAGFHIGSLWQRPQTDGRKLTHVAQAGDPWTAQLFFPDVFSEGRPIPWFATFIAWADGATADEAVVNALAKSKGLEGSYLKLGAAMGQLTEMLHVARTGRSFA